MKDINDLLSQFDDLQDLPVSEEMLGAYIEGNLNGADLRDVQNVINSDDDTMNLLDNVDDIILTPFDSSLSLKDNLPSIDFLDSDDMGASFSPFAILDEIISTNLVESTPIDDTIITTSTNSYQHDINHDDSIDYHHDLNSEDLTTNDDTFNISK